MNSLSGLTVAVAGRNADIYAWVPVMAGKGPDGAPVPISVDEDGAFLGGGLPGFGIPSYDEIDLGSYSGTNPGTVTYKLAGNTVATLTLTYDGSGNLTSVVRS